MNKLLGTIAVLFALVGSLYAADQHFAKAADLEKKADSAAVISLQREILRDKKEEVEYDIFVLERKERDELEEYQLQKLRIRQKELEKSLE